MNDLKTLNIELVAKENGDLNLDIDQMLEVIPELRGSACDDECQKIFSVAVVPYMLADMKHINHKINLLKPYEAGNATARLEWAEERFATRLSEVTNSCNKSIQKEIGILARELDVAKVNLTASVQNNHSKLQEEVERLEDSQQELKQDLRNVKVCIMTLLAVIVILLIYIKSMT